MDARERLSEAKRILAHEAASVAAVAGALDEAFGRVVDRILACPGNVVITGVGKPYLIAQKISASLASTGTPSIALHPVDALHGDLGRICKRDVVIALSNSGASQEIVQLLPALTGLGVYLVAMTGNLDSPLSRSANDVLLIGHIEEPCRLGLTPTSSTTAMLALGDALTLVLAEERGFQEEDYAKLHPGGDLGRRLLSVGKAMRPLDRTPVVNPWLPLLDVLKCITAARAGAAFVADETGLLLGIFTDGDMRRIVAERPEALREPVERHMTRNPKCTMPDTRLNEALEILRHHLIDELPVVDHQGRLCGYLDIQDIFRG